MKEVRMMSVLISGHVKLLYKREKINKELLATHIMQSEMILY